jgi:hypothetical protein
MIRLTRQRAAKAIPAKFRGQARLESELKLLKLRAGGEKPDSGHWTAAKPQLRKESGGKCAYCEGPTDLVAHADVEHFRPKAVYWWLAYCYDNYLYACQICNQVYKSDQFPCDGPQLAGPTMPARATDASLRALLGTFAPDPLQDGGGLARADFETGLRRERARLLHPYDDTPDAEPPEAFLKWHADETLKEVAVAARKGDAVGRRKFAACESLFGLNREELRRWRWVRYADLKAFKDILDALDAQPKKDQIEKLAKARLAEMIADAAPFAAMGRYFVNDVWNLDIVPNAGS